MVRWRYNLDVAVTMTIGWIGGVLWGPAWYWSPAFFVSVLSWGVVWDVVLVLLRRRRKPA